MLGISSSCLGYAAHLGCGVLKRLGLEGIGQVFTAARHGAGSPNVGAWRHHGEIGRCRDERPRRGRPGAARRYVNGGGNIGFQKMLSYLTGRTQQAARRIQAYDDYLGTFPFGKLYTPSDEPLRDGADDAFDFQQQDVPLLSLHGAGQSRSYAEQRQQGNEGAPGKERSW